MLMAGDLVFGIAKGLNLVLIARMLLLKPDPAHQVEVCRVISKIIEFRLDLNVNE